MKLQLKWAALVVLLSTAPATADEPLPLHHFSSVMAPDPPQDTAARQQSGALNRVGKEALQENRFPAAESAFRGAITIHTGWGPSYYGLAQALTAQGKTPEAIQIYRELIYPRSNWVSSTGTETRTLMNYAALLAQTGQWAEAVSIYEKALPDLPGGDLPKIDVHFDPRVPQPTELLAAAHIALGLAANFGNDSDDNRAVDEYRKALSLAPDWDLANFYYGFGLRHVGRRAEAQAPFAKAAQMGNETLKKAVSVFSR